MSSRALTAGLASALLAAAFTALLLLGLDSVDHLVLFLLVPIMFLLGAVPIAVKIWRGTFDLCEITVPYFILFFLFYGVGGILVLYNRTVPYDSGVLEWIDEAVALCTLGFGALMLGYGLTGRVVRPVEPETGAGPGLFSLLVIYGVGYVGVVVWAILGQTPAHLGGIVSGVTSLITQMSFLSTFVTFYILYKVMSRTGGPAYRSVLIFIIIPTQLLSIFLNVGNKTVFILTTGLPIIAYWYARKRIPWKTILLATLFVIFIVFPLYYKYRTLQNIYLTHEAKVQKSLEEITGSNRSDTYAKDALNTVARRIAIINSTAVVIRECGRTVEYQNGATLWLGVISIAIPRFIWANKPSTVIGTEFGKTFRITHSLNYSAISISTVGELYWNFQLPGVIIGMFLIGVILRSIYQRFGAAGGGNPLRLAMYVTIMYGFLYTIEGSIGVVEGVVIKQMVILLLIERFVAFAGTLGARQGTFRLEAADLPR